MPQARDPLLRKGDYIFGSFLKPERVDGYINGVNPGDRDDVLGRFPFSEANVDEAVSFAASGLRTWRRISLNDRAGAIRRFRDGISRTQEKLARLMLRETGRPLWETRQEVLATARALDLFLDDGISHLAPRVMDDIGARSDRLPRGVVGILTPYTFPLLLPATQIAAALLSGNAVVFKPSKYVPGSGQAIAELLDGCRLPRGTFNMVQGPGSVVGHRLVANTSLDAVIFSGSYTTAQSIRQATASRPELPQLLQCGGKGMAIVLDDAEIERSVYEIMVGAFLSSGQRHTSTARVFVTDRIYGAFTEALVRRTSMLRMGHGAEADVFLGPLISESQRARYRRFLRALNGAGHTALVEGRAESPGGRKGFYARPAVVRVAWENGHPFLDEEPPGPILLVYRVSGWEEAVSLHNQSAFRGATSVFTSLENPLLHELRERLRTGTLNVNRGTIGASLRIAGVGLGRAANGLPGGLEILSFLTNPRAQMVESRPFENVVYLPGTGWGDDDEATTLRGSSQSGSAAQTE